MADEIQGTITQNEVTVEVPIVVVEVTASGGGGGVTDHGALTGLEDDDHPQYLTAARGDAAYDATGTAAEGDSLHIAAADPHAQYQKESEKGAANGYAPLNADGQVDPGYLPPGQAPVSDHGQLTGLDDPDHPIGAVVGLQSALDGKSPTSHNHAEVYDPAGTAASGDSAHTSAGDPHAQYQKESEKGAANGYAPLDGTGKVPEANLPQMPSQSDQGIVRWNGAAWRYKGATIVARPTDIPAWPDGDVWWDTSLDPTVTTPPSLAAVGDKWMPHGSVLP